MNTKAAIVIVVLQLARSGNNGEAMPWQVRSAGRPSELASDLIACDALLAAT
ncbi:MAG: hypothetical protein R3E54_12180 [Halioglobus sp.]